jgi:16S rRNA (guanine527-N7)-methyltransferase
METSGKVASAGVREALRQLAARFSECLSPRQEEQLEGYLGLLLEWNRSINLTGATTPADLISDHLPDSFALVRLVGAGGDLLDVGSGGGLPGIPAAVLRPDLPITLVEPRSRRRAFLSQVIHRLGLGGVTVLGGRAEDLRPGHAVAVARAVFPPDEWLAVGGRLVEPEGRVVVLIPSDSPWSPPAGVQVLDEVRYSAGARERLALSCFVPRGTSEAERST